MNPRAGIPALVALVGLVLSPVAAWAPETRVGMVDDAIKLMPRSLRIALANHRREVLRGALGPMTDEDGAEHRAPWAGGSLDSQIVTEASKLVEMLGGQTSFSELSAQFGRLGHYVMDASFPPGVSRDGGDARYAHFAAFCEDRRAKFRLVFYGHDDEHLGKDDFHGFAIADLPAAAAFDDRSIPFAVGSLAYSRAVNDLVRAWLTAWRMAGGDTGRTPYAKTNDEAEKE